MPLATTRPSHFRICGESLITSRFSTTPLYGLSSVFIVTGLEAAVLGVWFDYISVVVFFIIYYFLFFTLHFCQLTETDPLELGLLILEQ
jgi:hypothetical protein